MRYVVGVDGGGTKTIAALYREGEGVVKTASAGPANYRSEGKEAAIANIAKAVGGAARAGGVEVSDLAAVCMCIAGFDTEIDLPVPQAAMRELGYEGHAIIENDVVGAWAGATEAGTGLVAIAGTGSTSLGMNAQGALWRTDGWDYFLGDDGSGYAIGHAALRTALRMLDGREQPTALVQALGHVFGVNDAQSMRRVWDLNGLGKFEVAAFARSVADLAVQGDPVSRGILTDAGKALGASAVAIIHKLNMEGETFPVSTVGSVFKNEPWVTEPFRAAISAVAPGATFRAPAQPPEIGAALLALRRLDDGDFGSWTLGTGKRPIRRSLRIDEITRQ